MRRVRICFVVALALAGCATTISRDAAERRLAAWASPELVTFADEAEFRRYLRDYRAAARARREWWTRTAAEKAGSIVITGSRIAPTNPSITNVQETGVDEGDIVKQIGRFLIVLQDGRLFVADTAPAGGEGLALTDRANVYTDPASDMWYDELLVHGDRILVTGYSYDNGASEFTLFRLGADGRLTREDAFHIRSGDYYHRDNSATRLIDGDLVIYTPLDLTEMDADGRIALPTVARGSLSGGIAGSALPVIAHSDVYRPLVRTLDPTLHAVTVCPLENGEEQLRCRSRAFIASRQHRYYVTRGDVYLWVAPDFEDTAHLEDAAACAAGFGDPFGSLLYRIPVDGRAPMVLGLYGAGFDRFSLDVFEGRFRALTAWASEHCGADSEPSVQLMYAEVPLTRFGRRLEQAPRSDYAAIPSVAGRLINRFTDTHLVYGPIGDHRHFSTVYDPGLPIPARVVVVPLARSQDARILPLPHNLIRAERAGEDVVLTGYADPRALNVSLIDLGGTPRIGSTLRLEGRFESEGRSVAFNSRLGADGSGVMGLPTVPRREGSERWPWWTTPSDLTFLVVDGAGRLRSAGLLSTGFPDRDENRRYNGREDDSGIPGYRCEVSCTDWYGNARPIFTGGRIFALSATELIEGRLVGDRIIEIRRLNLAVASPRR